MDAIGEGRRGVERAFRIEAVAKLLRALCQLEERDVAVGAGDLEHTAAILYVRFRGFEDMRSKALPFFDDRVERPGNRAADRHRRARGDRSGTRHLVVTVAMRDLNDPGRDAEVVGHKAAIDRAVPLPARLHADRQQKLAGPGKGDGSAPSPGPMKVPDDKLRSVLGIASVSFKRGDQRLAIVDTALQG